MNSLDALPGRFVDKVCFEPNTGCWLWAGTILTLGYGQFKADGRRWQAHRYAYAHLVGDVPQGAELDHLCRVRHCVNPDHLEAVDHRTNLLRGVGWAATNAAKTECKRGHPLNAANTYTRGRSRQCRRCAQVSKARYEAKRRVPRE